MRTDRLEIEAKFALADPAALRERLRAERAEYLGRVRETNCFFDGPDHRLQRGGCGLRVRAIEVLDGPTQSATMTYKGPLQPGPLKTRPEYEVAIDDPAAAKALLAQLGFTQTFAFAKRRESWQLGACRVELDEVPHLGRFVEIEGPDDGTVHAAAARLGLAGQTPIAASYLALLARHCETHRLDPRTLLTV